MSSKAPNQLDFSYYLLESLDAFHHLFFYLRFEIKCLLMVWNRSTNGFQRLIYRLRHNPVALAKSDPEVHRVYWPNKFIKVMILLEIMNVNLRSFESILNGMFYFNLIFVGFSKSRFGSDNLRYCRVLISWWLILSKGYIIFHIVLIEHECSSRNILDSRKRSGDVFFYFVYMVMVLF